MNYRATEAELVESYALRLDDPIARELVARWYGATVELRAFMESERAEPLALSDVAALAEMFVSASRLQNG